MQPTDERAWRQAYDTAAVQDCAYPAEVAGTALREIGAIASEDQLRRLVVDVVQACDACGESCTATGTARV